jgi:hypothetical protein
MIAKYARHEDRQGRERGQGCGRGGEDSSHASRSERSHDD